MNPARTFGPSMVVCMSGGNCKTVTDGEWYWIYYVAPLSAAWLVAEVTDLMEWNVDEEVEAQTINEAANTPEVQTLSILKDDMLVNADDEEQNQDQET